jgi:hypothetical protein
LRLDGRRHRLNLGYCRSIRQLELIVNVSHPRDCLHDFQRFVPLGWIGHLAL